MLQYWWCIFKEFIDALGGVERLKYGIQIHMLIGVTFCKYMKMNG